MSKPESAAKAARRHKFEQRQINYLSKQKGVSANWGVFIYSMVIITMVYIADELTTQLGSQMQSVIAERVFGAFGNNAVGTLSMLTTVFTAIGGALAFLYKPLSDKLGRKLFLFLNALGMGAGTLIIALTTSIPAYLIGTLMVFFFIPNDIQQIYIFESAPKRYRATVYAVIKFCATMGMLLIPALRSAVMPTNAEYGNVYLIIACVAAAAGLFALLFVREPDVFVKERLAYLNMTDEEREEKKAREREVASQGGIIPAIKFSLKHKQLLWITIAAGLMGAGMIITVYYSSTMSLGYAAPFMENLPTDFEQLSKEAQNAIIAAINSQVERDYITPALFLFPVGSAIIQLAQGFLSDRLGRKPAIITLSVVCIISYILFFVGCRFTWDPYAVGFLCGLMVGGYWAATDIYAIITSESCPTNMRASVMNVRMILGTVLGGIPYLIGMLAITLSGDKNIPIICLCISIPFMVLGLVATMLKIHETKGTDLNKVTGCEWDKVKPEETPGCNDVGI